MWSCRGLPSAPTRPQSWTRKVASDICWISASTTPAPMAWTVPAGIMMQSPAFGSKRCSSGSTSPDSIAAAKSPAGDARLQAGVDQAAGLGVRRSTQASVLPLSSAKLRPRSSSGWTWTERT